MLTLQSPRLQLLIKIIDKKVQDITGRTVFAARSHGHLSFGSSLGSMTSEKLRAQLALKSSSSEKQNQKAKSSVRSTKDIEIPKSRK